MKIALDATPLTIASGGVQRYTAELTRALAENFPADEFWLLSDQHFTPPSPNLKVGIPPTNPLEKRWWLWGLPREISRLHVIPRDVAHALVHAASPLLGTQATSGTKK